MELESLIQDESVRRHQFPVTTEEVFLANAGTAPIPRIAAEAVARWAALASSSRQENEFTREAVNRGRRLGAQLIGAAPGEIALLGPTSLGLNLIAQGLDWQTGDRVVYYDGDYPANVYPWMELSRRGVEAVSVRPDQLGVIDWSTIEPHLNERTRLVALATCHFVSGWRIDVDDIGQRLHERGILFALDAIQTLGAWPMDVEHVDFLSADSHKWMLGPAAAGIVYVDRRHFETLRPALLGSWNVVSPDFIAQSQIDFYAGGRRYEPGMLNLPGIVGMAAALELLLDIGIDAIAARLRKLREYLVHRADELGYRPYLCELEGDMPESARSAIVTLVHDEVDLEAVNDRLIDRGIIVSLRHDPWGRAGLRISPHFYNTTQEIDQLIEVMAEAR